MRLVLPCIVTALHCLSLVQFTTAQSFDNLQDIGTGAFSDSGSVDTTWNNHYHAYGNRYTGNDNVGSITNLERREAQDFYLRLMPLGASIVEGVQSTDGNGFRKWIRSQLRFEGWRVNMVGSKQNGDMADKDNEGHPGFVTTQIQDSFDSAKGSMPNLVLLNAGTNDCVQDLDIDSIKTRYKALIDDIFDSIPGVTVITSTLVRSRDYAPCSENVSQQMRELVEDYEKDPDKRIALADIETAMGAEGYLSDDGIHPDDDGYKLFAAVWWAAISSVESKIQPPNNVTGLDDGAITAPRTCQKSAGGARGPVQSQQGSGHDDGKYVHADAEHQSILSARIEKGNDSTAVTEGVPDRMFFADIVVPGQYSNPNEALDDWIRVLHGTDGTNTYYYRENLGNGTFGTTGTFDIDMNCDSGPKYAFADFDGDGLADFYCLQLGSAISVSINQGGNPPTFKSLGQVVPTHTGFTDQSVRIADIDGDGRADYCLVQSNGTVICSRNGGQGTDYFWQGFETESGLRELVFDKKATTDIAGVQFGDINGDFRSDYLYVNSNGSVETWANQRGWGSGIVPDWTSSGITFEGQSESGVQKEIKWGRVFGSGKLDFIYLKEEKGWYDVHVWENQGSGATERKADGDYYCDMRGTGRDDYIWIWNDGHAAEMYANVQNPPYWGHDVKIEINVPGPREGIHLADWDGDGRCDVLVQDKATGSITPWINNWDEEKKELTFTKTDPTQALCSEGWGVSIFDLGVRIADIDGDKRADVLCIDKSGRITAWLNKQDAMEDIGQVKKTEGWDRANLRFADVESSGRADLIWVNKYTGEGHVYKNKGPAEDRSANSDSWVSWDDRGVLYSAINRGECMHFSNQGGLGRADLIEVFPVSNTANTYFNECQKSGGDDDPTLSDPGLPAYEQPDSVEPDDNSTSNGTVSR